MKQIIASWLLTTANSTAWESVRIRSYSGPYSVRMWGNTDQNNSEYENFLHSVGSKGFKERDKRGSSNLM